VALGFLGRFWSSGWIWASLGLLIGIIVAMSLIASRHFHRVRKAAGSLPRRDEGTPARRSRLTRGSPPPPAIREPSSHDAHRPRWLGCHPMAHDLQALLTHATGNDANSPKATIRSGPRR
jgi:hypothetical protein